MYAQHLWSPSHAMGKNVHVWTYGHAGRPVIALPTSGGYAHEWQQHGVVDALADLLEMGRIRIWQPETNVSETWNRRDAPLAWRMQRHLAYEQFVTNELVPHIRHVTGRSDIVILGPSVGALYAVNFALKFPHLLPEAIGLSGRYEARTFTNGQDNTDVYYNNPLSYVWNLHGDPLRHIQQQAHVTLVCGQGAHEKNCLQETLHLAQGLQQKAVPLKLDVWGRDSAHEWPWWRRQIRHHLVQRV
jgi:esterase/lipase superfamily enzyme